MEGIVRRVCDNNVDKERIPPTCAWISPGDGNYHRRYHANEVGAPEESRPFSSGQKGKEWTGTQTGGGDDAPP